MTDISSYIDAHLDEALEQLRQYVALPSVAAQKRHIPETAAFVKGMLEAVGAKAEILPKQPPGHPVVVGELPAAPAPSGVEGPTKTLLLYNHYDVQPAEPFELWTSPPFEMRRDGDTLYARGISDNKGHLISRLFAIRALQALNGGRLPVMIKFLIEGDEEIGSAKLEEFVEEHRERLAADVCLHEGGGVNATGRPIVSLGVKGIFNVELRARTAARDSHSSYGATVPNAAWRLVWALSSLKDASERVRIPGFYDAVRPPSDQEERFVREAPDEDDEARRNLGVRESVCGVRGFAYRKRMVFEPVLNINGLSSGYEGEGTKTVLPAYAMAKLDFRLVPDQDPRDLIEKLRAHLKAEGFGDIEVIATEGEFPARSPADHPFVELVQRTAREVYGKEPVVYPNMAGTQPLYPMMKHLGVPMASAGIGHPDARAHAPDENIRLPDFILGTKHVAAIIEGLAAG
jgi:acetylornithine deacetylase/succinyl-diaminopimelate desuccinylase-like protein